jgi:hypothetical protein
MAYPKLAEGDRVFAAGSGVTASTADILELQDQLKTMLGPREFGLTYWGEADSAEWTYDWTNGYWVSSGGAGPDNVLFKLPLYAGQKLTEIHFTIEVATNGAGGDLLLQRRSRTPTAGSMGAPSTVATIDADIWNGLTDNYATEMNYTGLSYVLAANYNYWLLLAARAGVVCKVHEAAIKAQFGN